MTSATLNAATLTPADEAFYQVRRLPCPAAELWPHDVASLIQALRDADPARHPRVLLGQGQHLDPGALGERVFQVLRTGALRRLLHVDGVSELAQAQAGITWAALQDELEREGLGLHRYALYPSDSTLGGLLSRRQPMMRALGWGDLREGVSAISAVSALGQYSPLPAPRKSSGPDLRHLFLGAQGALGALLEVTLAVCPAQTARAWAIEASTLAQALEGWRWALRLQARISWSHWSQRSGRLTLAMHLPGAICRGLDQAAKTRFGAQVTILDGPQVQQLRAELERQHPDQRARPEAAQTTVAVMTLQALDAMAQAPPRCHDLVVTPWTDHGATIYLVRSLAPAPDLNHGLDHGLDHDPALALRGALWAQPLLGAGRQRWSEHAQQLKRALDPKDLLAIGP